MDGRLGLNGQRLDTHCGIDDQRSVMCGRLIFPHVAISRRITQPDAFAITSVLKSRAAKRWNTARRLNLAKLSEGRNASTLDEETEVAKSLNRKGGSRRPPLSIKIVIQLPYE